MQNSSKYLGRASISRKYCTGKTPHCKNPFTAQTAANVSVVPFFCYTFIESFAYIRYFDEFCIYSASGGNANQKHMSMNIIRNLIVALLVCSGAVVSVSAQPTVDAYRRCLEQNGENPIDYIFRLFETSDVVVLGERDHRDVTQYEFITRLLADPRFAERVGHVYTEVGVVNMTGSANRLVKTDWPTEDAFRENMLRHLRDEDYGLLWEKTNRSIFLDSLWHINRRLEPSKRITIGLTDVAFDWYKVSSPYKYKKWINAHTLDAETCPPRDREMARNFLSQYKRQKPIGGRRKALLITSQPHALSLSGKRNEGYIIRQKLGRDRVSIVCLNWFVWCRQGEYHTASRGQELIDDGRWDAAFEQTGCRSVAVSIGGTPFGECKSWYDDSGQTWQDQADGLIFYRPFYDFRCSIGVRGVLDGSCRSETMRRADIESDGQSQSSFEDLAAYYNTERTVRCVPDEVRDYMMRQMRKWLP